jgi:hypothetical protein
MLPSVVALLITPQFPPTAFRSAMTHPLPRRQSQVLLPASSQLGLLQDGSNVEALRRNDNKQGFNPVWAVTIPSLASVREMASALMIFFMSNEWQINLIKNALTLFCIRFVVCTYVDISNQRTFQMAQLPRLFLAIGLTAGAAIWLDSIFVFPLYVINICKNALCLLVASRIPLVLRAITTRVSKARRRRSFRKAKAQQTPSKEILIPKKPVVEKEPPPLEPVEEAEEVVVAEEENEPVEPEAPVVPEEPKTVGTQEDSKKVTTVKGIASAFVFLSNLEERIAEFQSKTITELFSTDVDGTIEDRLNEQYQKILEKFDDGKNSSS